LPLLWRQHQQQFFSFLIDFLRTMLWKLHSQPRLCKCIIVAFASAGFSLAAFSSFSLWISASDLTVGFTTALKVQLSVFSSWDYGAFFVIIIIITFEFVSQTNSCEGPNCEKLPNAFS
jgi:hypothetical protein